MADDKIIKFPGAAKPAPAAAAASATPAATGSPATPAIGDRVDGKPGDDGLTEDQRKAIQVVVSGLPFVCIGIRPTDRGADFFTAVGGTATDLRNAADHLPGVIERAFAKKGL